MWCIGAFPQLVTVELVESYRIRFGRASIHRDRDWYRYMRPCAIIALKFPHLDTIKMGKETIKVKFDNEAGRVTMEYLKPQGNIIAGEVEVREVCKGLHDPAVWVEEDKTTHKEFLAVNPKCEILSY